MLLLPARERLNTEDYINRLFYSCCVWIKIIFSFCCYCCCYCCRLLLCLDLLCLFFMVNSYVYVAPFFCVCFGWVCCGRDVLVYCIGILFKDTKQKQKITTQRISSLKWLGMITTWKIIIRYKLYESQQFLCFVFNDTINISNLLWWLWLL